MSLGARDVKSKTTVSSHYTPMITFNNKIIIQKSWQGCGTSETLINWWWEFKLTQLIWKSGMLGIQNLVWVSYLACCVSTA